MNSPTRGAAMTPRRSVALAQTKTNTSGEDAAITLPITVLPTGFGLPGEPAPRYPANINVEAPPQLQLSAYGAAALVWLGPRSWTGDAGVGVDGNIFVHLYPVGQGARSGRHITYTAIPACVGCMLSSAAPYFSDALKRWNREYNSDGKNPVVVPTDLAVTRVTPHLVIYALPNENGFIVRGASFYDPDGDAFYEEVRLTMPAADDRLANFLLKYFRDHTGLR